MPEKLVEAEKAEEEYNSDVDFSTLVVREGDCLSEISRLVRVPINVLQRVNSIANIECLKVKMQCRYKKLL
jgi:LysM repeat protein